MKIFHWANTGNHLDLMLKSQEEAYRKEGRSEVEISKWKNNNKSGSIDVQTDTFEFFTYKN